MKLITSVHFAICIFLLNTICSFDAKSNYSFNLAANEIRAFNFSVSDTLKVTLSSNTNQVFLSAQATAIPQDPLLHSIQQRETLQSDGLYHQIYLLAAAYSYEYWILLVGAAEASKVTLNAEVLPPIKIDYNKMYSFNFIGTVVATINPVVDYGHCVRCNIFCGTNIGEETYIGDKPEVRIFINGTGSFDFIANSRKVIDLPDVPEQTVTSVVPGMTCQTYRFRGGHNKHATFQVPIHPELSVSYVDSVMSYYDRIYSEAAFYNDGKDRYFTVYNWKAGTFSFKLLKTNFTPIRYQVNYTLNCAAPQDLHTLVLPAGAHGDSIMVATTGNAKILSRDWFGAKFPVETGKKVQVFTMYGQEHFFNINCTVQEEISFMAMPVRDRVTVSENGQQVSVEWNQDRNSEYIFLPGAVSVVHFRFNQTSPGPRVTLNIVRFERPLSYLDGQFEYIALKTANTIGIVDNLPAGVYRFSLTTKSNATGTLTFTFSEPIQVPNNQSIFINSTYDKPALLMSKADSDNHPHNFSRPASLRNSPANFGMFAIFSYSRASALYILTSTAGNVTFTIEEPIVVYHNVPFTVPASRRLMTYRIAQRFQLFHFSSSANVSFYSYVSSPPANEGYLFASFGSQEYTFILNPVSTDVIVTVRQIEAYPIESSETSDSSTLEISSFSSGPSTTSEVETSNVSPTTTTHHGHTIWIVVITTVSIVVFVVLGIISSRLYKRYGNKHKNWIPVATEDSNETLMSSFAEDL